MKRREKQSSFPVSTPAQHRPSVSWHLKCPPWTPFQLGVGDGTETVGAIREWGRGCWGRERRGKVRACVLLWSNGQSCEMGSLRGRKTNQSPVKGKLLGRRGVLFA